MPIGVQLVGRRGNDARLLRTARWLVKTLTGDGRKSPARKPGTRKGQTMTAHLISGVIGIGMLAAFLGFMVVWVPAPPLIVIVVLVLAAAVL